MADNVTIDAMIGGDTVAADDIGGIKFQRIKLIHGIDGTNDGDVAETNPFPVGIFEFGGTAVTLGQKAMSASIPVVLASDQSVTLDVNLDAANDEVTVYGSDDGGTTRRIIKTDSGGAVQVDVESSALPSGASTLAEQQTQTTHLSNTATSLGVMDDWDNTASDGASVSGDVAHDGVDAGEPVKLGMKAIAHGSNPTAVAANDRTNLYANRAGIPFFIGGHPNIVTLEAAYTAAQTDAAIVSVSAGTIIVATQVQVTADNANSVDVGFRVGFGTASTPTTTGVVLTHPGMPSGSGVSRGDGSGMLGFGGDGSDLRITSEVPTGGSIRVLVSYFTIES